MAHSLNRWFTVNFTLYSIVDNMDKSRLAISQQRQKQANTALAVVHGGGWSLVQFQCVLARL
jgi:hypothetical protein